MQSSSMGCMDPAVRRCPLDGESDSCNPAPYCFWRSWTNFYGSPGTGPNCGGGVRRLEAASYAEAIFKMTSSFPGSARKTREKGRPGAGKVIGVLLLVEMYRFLSALNTKTGS